MSLKQRIIDYGLYGYVPGEFFPIKQDGELVNKREFVTYKIRQWVKV